MVVQSSVMQSWSEPIAKGAKVLHWRDTWDSHNLFFLFTFLFLNCSMCLYHILVFISPPWAIYFLAALSDLHFLVSLTKIITMMSGIVPPYFTGLFYSHSHPYPSTPSICSTSLPKTWLFTVDTPSLGKVLCYHFYVLPQAHHGVKVGLVS